MPLVTLAFQVKDEISLKKERNLGEKIYDG